MLKRVKIPDHMFTIYRKRDSVSIIRFHTVCNSHGHIVTRPNPARVVFTQLLDDYNGRIGG